MRFGDDEDLRAFGDRFARGAVPRPEWTHCAHLAAAIHLILQRDDLVAERDMPGMIRALNEANGVRNSDSEGYHHTITLASLGAVRAFIADCPAGSPPSRIANAIAATRYGKSGWLFDHWSEDCLLSPEARRRWVAPDKLALPFAVHVRAGDS